MRAKAVVVAGLLAAASLVSDVLVVSGEDVDVHVVSAKPSPPVWQDLWEAALDQLPWVIDIRREFHRHPELMYNEKWTSDRIAAALEELQVSFTRGWAVNTKHAELAAKGLKSGEGGTGIVAEIGNGQSPCVLLRADIDALPIRESPDLVPYASENSGEMHACGHDAHTAMLLGAAALLKDRERQGGINGTIRLIWQPAEEGGAGGKRMVEEGVLSKFPPVQAAFGFHQWPFEPLGVVAAKPGTMMAASELFDITIHGKGGHAAMPHHVIDPIVTAAQVVSGIQSITSRETSPLVPAVVSVTMLRAGDAYNVIPDGATVAGTLRSLSKVQLERLRSRLSDVVHAVANAHQCNATISWSPDAYPPTVNDPSLLSWVEDIAAEASSEGKVKIIEPTMGGEDFSFIAQEVPSVFLALGQGEAAWTGVAEDGSEFGPLDTRVTVHNSKFVLNEGVLRRGMALHAHLALQRLHYLTQS